MMPYWSTSDIPVATRDLLWVSSVFCEVPRALPGKPGNTKHVIPNPDGSETQPIMNPWAGARYNPSLHQTPSHKLTVLYKPSGKPSDIHICHQQTKRCCTLSQSRFRFLSCLFCLAELLISSIWQIQTPNIQPNTQRNDNVKNPWRECQTVVPMRHMTFDVSHDQLTWLWAALNEAGALLWGGGEGEELSLSQPSLKLTVTLRNIKRRPAHVRVLTSMAYFNCTVLHTNTHLGYDWTYAQHTPCVFLGAGTHSLLMLVEHQVSPRQKRKKETSNPTQAASPRGIKPNWRSSTRRPL